MTNLDQVQKHAEVIGADGIHVGIVDHVSGDRIKLAKKDSPDGHHHYIDGGLVSGVEANGVVRLSANADVAATLETRH